MLIGIHRKVLLAGLGGMLLAANGVHADASRPGDAELQPDELWTFKLTPSYYVTTHQSDATDINARADHGSHAVWLAHYQQGNKFEQTRTGYEYTEQFGFVQLVPSLQLATHGFAGGSLNAKIGDSVYALLGFGRTNLHDYYNLNFDPNDSIVYGVGTRLLSDSTLSLYTVKDNRLHTGQMVSHALWRWAAGEGRRWTVDVSSKHGRPAAEEDSVSGRGLTVTYDCQAVFFRVAQEQKVNFSKDNQTRLSLGARF